MNKLSIVLTDILESSSSEIESLAIPGAIRSRIVFLSSIIFYVDGDRDGARRDSPIALARRRSDRRPSSSSYRNYSWCSVAYRRGSSLSIAISIIGTSKWLGND